MRKEPIEELFKDLSDAPTGGVNEDFTIGTLKESHTNLFIRTVAGHLVSLNYRKQSGWISVKERIPERWKQVIVCDECKDVGVARHLGNGRFEWIDDENIAFVTHWMPLPEPPDTERGE